MLAEQIPFRPWREDDHTLRSVNAAIAARLSNSA
jgi:hypothetical protein